MKYYVQVTGEKDEEYTVEAEDAVQAEEMAVEAFEREFGSVGWSGINAWDITQQVNESGESNES
jgi:hypothetical protein